MTDIGMLQVGLEGWRDHSSDPLVEVAEHDTRAAQFRMSNDPFVEKPPCLLPMFENCGTEMDVEHVQDRAVYLNVRAQATAPLVTGRRNIKIPVDMNWET